MKLAVIPARGGSKRIPQKNIKLFHGKPIIAYSIEAALNSGCFDKVIVSTDDQAIADIAMDYGADVPFMRPKKLADDITATVPVIAHAIEAMQQQGFSPRWVCCIYATAPFLCAQDLKAGLKKMTENNSEYSFSVSKFSFPIQRAISMDREQKVDMFYPEYEQTRSQDLTEAYHDAGQFYWGQRDAFLSNKPIFSSHSYAVVLPQSRVQDIDTLDDWKRAEYLFEILKKT